MSELKIGSAGDQGAPMAEAISNAGFELHVWARRVHSFDSISIVKYLRHDSLKSLAVMVDVLSICLCDERSGPASAVQPSRVRRPAPACEPTGRRAPDRDVPG